jgi:hypothetical protein
MKLLLRIGGGAVTLDILQIDFLFFHLLIKRLQKFFNTLSDRLVSRGSTCAIYLSMYLSF